MTKKKEKDEEEKEKEKKLNGQYQMEKDETVAV